MYIISTKIGVYTIIFAYSLYNLYEILDMYIYYIIYMACNKANVFLHPFCLLFFFEVLCMSDAELPAFVPKKTSMAAVSRSEMKGPLDGACPTTQNSSRPPKKRTGGTRWWFQIFFNVHPYLGK